MKTKDENELYHEARRHVRKIKGFYSHALMFCIFIPFLAFINWRYSPHNWWIVWPLLGWGVFGLGFHALGIFGRDLFLGREWEERKIKDEMERMKYRH